MSDRQNRQDEFASIEDVQIEPLSDEALEDVAGGTTAAAGSSDCCSCRNCSADTVDPGTGTIGTTDPTVIGRSTA